MIGTRFGKLTITEQTNMYYQKQLIWKLVCECGNHAYLTAPALLRGERHCGCETSLTEQFRIILHQYGEMKRLTH